MRGFDRALDVSLTEPGVTDAGLVSLRVLTSLERLSSLRADLLAEDQPLRPCPPRRFPKLSERRRSLEQMRHQFHRFAIVLRMGAVFRRAKRRHLRRDARFCTRA